MKKIVTVIEQRPNYYRGQLLLESDFLAEQNYHVNARRRHNLNLHDWGIVRGFSVSRESANSVIIKPGFAIDPSGSEIFLEEAKHVNLTEFGPDESLRIGLACEEPPDSEQGAAESLKMRDFCASITVSNVSENRTGLTIATLHLDHEGQLGPEAIDYSQTRYVRILARGSITSAELHEQLKKGWLRLPFRPDPLVNEPEGETEIPPAFRVGATESLSPDPKEAGKKDRGAAGTMAIPIPPSVTQVTRFRIAGSINEGQIKITLLLGGWDRNENKHVKKEILRKEINSTSASKEKWFEETFNIDDTAIDPEYQTMSLWLRGTRRTAVSLIGVEFVYYSESVTRSRSL